MYVNVGMSGLGDDSSSGATNWTGVLIGLAALAVVWYIAPKKGRA
jgi:hypothetical protein